MKTLHLFYTSETYLTMICEEKKPWKYSSACRKLLKNTNEYLLRFIRFWIHGLTIIGEPWQTVVKSHSIRTTKEDNNPTLKRSRPLSFSDPHTTLAEQFFYLYLLKA